MERGEYEVTEELLGAKFVPNSEDYLSIREVLALHQKGDYIREGDVCWVASINSPTGDARTAVGWRLFKPPLTKLPEFDIHVYVTKRR